MKYSDIKEQLSYLSRQEGYKLLLKTDEWQYRREVQISKDNFCCSKCGTKEGFIYQYVPIEEFNKQWETYKRELAEFKKQDTIQSILDGTYKAKPMPPSRDIIVGEVTLHVHHTLYIYSKLPWEYPEYLQTLCEDCHKLVHSTTTIYTYRDETLKERKEIITCPRCDGTGYIPAFYYVDNGICYECWGAGGHLDYTSDWETVKQ